MERGEPTQSPSEDLCSVCTNSARDGTKGFTAADNAVYGRRKENQAWGCFRGADRHWPSQSTMWNCSHRVVTRHTVIPLFWLFSGQNLRLETWQSFFPVHNDKWKRNAVCWAVSNHWERQPWLTLLSHLMCKPPLAEHSHNLTHMTAMPLTHFYCTHCLDIEMQAEHNMDY